MDVARDNVDVANFGGWCGCVVSVVTVGGVVLFAVSKSLSEVMFNLSNRMMSVIVNVDGRDVVAPWLVRTKGRGPMNECLW